MITSSKEMLIFFAILLGVCLLALLICWLIERWNRRKMDWVEFECAFNQLKGAGYY